MQIKASMNRPLFLATFVAQYYTPALQNHLAAFFHGLGFILVLALMGVY